MSSRFSDADVRKALNLTGTAAASYSAVTTDTRQLTQDALFVALSGPRFDGHRFLEAARDGGATGAVVREGTAPLNGLQLYQVPDTLHALGQLATERRRRISGPVIAITGQNGKTSVKEMVAAVLAVRWRTHRTPANENNLVGVPLTILNAPEDVEALVVEAGASVPGEIARYRRIIEPDIAVVINAGSGHLEGFGSVEAVMREKLELVRQVPLAIVGTSPATLREGALANGAQQVITAGLDGADLIPDAVALSDDGRARVSIGDEEFLLAARGEHQAGNAMFAWAIGMQLGLTPATVARALEQFTLPGGRGELQQHGDLTLVHDAYNANPESFKATISLAGRLRTGRRLVFVAGTMRELGSGSAGLHKEIAAELSTLAPEVLVLVGDFVPAFSEFRAAYAGSLVEAPDAEVAGHSLAPLLRGNELVVLKGSRGTALEHILPAILPRSPSA